MAIGEQQSDVGAHRMTGDHHRPTDLLDDRGDVVGVLAEPDGARLGPTAPAPTQVDGNDVQAAGELVCHRIP